MRVFNINYEDKNLVDLGGKLCSILEIFTQICRKIIIRRLISKFDKSRKKILKLIKSCYIYAELKYYITHCKFHEIIYVKFLKSEMPPSSRISYFLSLLMLFLDVKMVISLKERDVYPATENV